MARLICFILIFALFLAFIVLNLPNACDVGLGFYTFEKTPVYITAMISFFLGMIFTIPILLVFKDKNPQKPKKEKPGKKNKSHDEKQDVIQKESGSYGID